MWRYLTAGTLLLVTGALKMTGEVRLMGRAPTLEDYLAFRCGAGDEAALVTAHGDLASVLFHCWGCYAMAAGAAILAAGLIRQAASARLAARR
ncbi:hypothetical protein [Hyphomonas sp.]|uniref:hypothetical protein n=1 Tax=Hyphomonas sp. TaxID=87 RepID=UPI003918E5C2